MRFLINKQIFEICHLASFNPLYALLLLCEANSALRAVPPRWAALALSFDTAALPGASGKA